MIRGWPIIPFLDKRFKQINRIPMEKGNDFYLCYHRLYAFAMRPYLLPKKYQLGLTLFEKKKHVKPNWHFSSYDLVCNNNRVGTCSMAYFLG